MRMTFSDRPTIIDNSPSHSYSQPNDQTTRSNLTPESKLKTVAVIANASWTNGCNLQQHD